MPSALFPTLFRAGKGADEVVQLDCQVEEEWLREAVLCQVHPGGGEWGCASAVGREADPRSCVPAGHELRWLDVHLQDPESASQGRSRGGVQSLW